MQLLFFLFFQPVAGERAGTPRERPGRPRCGTARDRDKVEESKTRARLARSGSGRLVGCPATAATVAGRRVTESARGLTDGVPRRGGARQKKQDPKKKLNTAKEGRGGEREKGPLVAGHDSSSSSSAVDGGRQARRVHRLLQQQRVWTRTSGDRKVLVQKKVWTAAS
jgi:hypothetical protein